MIYVSSYLFLSCVISPDSDLYNWLFWLLSSYSISVSTMLNTCVMSSFIQLVLQIVALSFDLGLSFHIHITITLSFDLGFSFPIHITMTLSFDLGLSFHIHITITLSFDLGLTISLSLTLWALNILFLSLTLWALNILFLSLTLWALNIFFLSLELQALSTLFLHMLCLPLRHSCMYYLGETFFGITP